MSTNVHLVRWRHHAHSIHECKYNWNVRATDNGRGGHYNSTLEQGQCFVLTLLTLPQTAPERMSNVGHSRAAIGQSEGRCPLTCTVHWPPTVSHTTYRWRVVVVQLRLFVVVVSVHWLMVSLKAIPKKFQFGCLSVGISFWYICSPGD